MGKYISIPALRGRAKVMPTLRVENQIVICQSAAKSMNGFEHETNVFVHSQTASRRRLWFFWYGTANAQRCGMKHLRERGIYLAPNGESFVASRARKTTSDGKRILSRLGSRLSCFLFGRYEWAFHGMPDYEVATTGNILALKQPSDFRPDQLIDTGATAGSH